MSILEILQKKGIFWVKSPEKYKFLIPEKANNSGSKKGPMGTLVGKALIVSDAVRLWNKELAKP